MELKQVSYSLRWEDWVGIVLPIIMADDRSGSVCDVSFEAEIRFVVIDWSSIDRYQSIPIN